MTADALGMYDWTPFYQELADKLLPFKSRQEELVSLSEQLRQKGLKVGALQDKDETGRQFILKEIDPFTFFGSFNRGTTTDMRVAILNEMKSRLGISAPVPFDFSGIPVLNNMKSWFFSWSYQRKAGDIARLWEVFEHALQPNPLESEQFAQAFDAALEVRNTNLNLTMGLFRVLRLRS